MSKSRNPTKLADKKLTPGEEHLFTAWKIYSALKAHPNKEITIEGIAPEDKFDPTSPKGMRFTHPVIGTIVLLSPASDHAETLPVTLGSAPMPQMAQRIATLHQEDKEQKRGNVTYIIPISQCQKMLKIKRRLHWTLLIGNGESKQATHWDPKNAGRALYPTAPMKTLSSDNGGFEITREECIDWQGRFDFTSCGFLNAEIAHRAVIDLVNGGDGAPDRLPIPDAFRLRREFVAAERTKEYKIFRSFLGNPIPVHINADDLSPLEIKKENSADRNKYALAGLIGGIFIGCVTGMHLGYLVYWGGSILGGMLLGGIIGSKTDNYFAEEYNEPGYSDSTASSDSSTAFIGSSGPKLQKGAHHQHTPVTPEATKDKEWDEDEELADEEKPQLGHVSQPPTP